jgi:hypothetical protein
MGNGEVWFFLRGERGRAKAFQNMLNYQGNKLSLFGGQKNL